MLRVIASRNAKEYYAESLKREDYYTEGQEIRGEWQGIGAEKLGLSGAVDQAAFDALCENRKPGTDERLTQRNKGKRIVGYDFKVHGPKADAPYFEAVFHARFARQLAEAGYRIERTAKGWELAGVPQRVLDEFSRRTEQVEQKAKELGITSAKEKDGLAALTRERKQKRLSKAE